MKLYIIPVILKINHYGDKPRKSNVINGGGYGDSTDDIEAYQTKGMIDLCNEINKWGDVSQSQQEDWGQRVKQTDNG